MRTGRTSWLIAAALVVGAPVGAAVRVTGTVFTQDTVAVVEVKVWARGEAVLAAPERLRAPLAETRVAPGAPFSIDLKDAAPPLRVEAVAAGHVAAAFEVVFPAQAALPPAWLPRGAERRVHVVENAKPAAGALVWGELRSEAAAAGFGRWLPCLPVSTADAAGTVRFRAEARHRAYAVALAADGRWGRTRETTATGRNDSLALDSQPVVVKVTDERGRPLAGARIAASDGPIGTAVTTDGNGAATVEARVAESWTIVALDAVRAARSVRNGPPPASGLTLLAQPFDALEVVWTGAPATLALTATWIPTALRGDAPLLASGGKARLPWLGKGGPLAAVAPGFDADGGSLTAFVPVFVVRPRATVRVEGTVVDGGGAGLAGVPVWSETTPEWMRASRTRMRLRSRMMERSELPVAVSDARGRFTVAELPADLLAVEARLAGLPPASTPQLEAKPGSVQRVTLTLRAGRVVRARVFDPDHRPLDGATAAVFADPSALESGGRTFVVGADEEEPVARGASDAEGRLEVPGVAEGGVRVELSRKGFARRTDKGVVTERGLDLGEVVLEPGVDVRGRVVDDDGNGVGDADVFIDEFGFGRGDKAEARSDPQGYFTIADQPRQGSLALSARAEGFASTAPTRLNLPPEELALVRVHREVALEGRVVDRETGDGIPRATVLATRRIERSVGGVVQMGMFMTAGAAESDDDGRFRISGLLPTRLDLRVQAAAYRSRSLEVELPTDRAPEPVTVVMERGLTIAGTVVDAAGAPVGGVTVAARAATQGGGMRVSFGGGSVMSGPDGRFTLAGLDPGRYQVTATGERGARASDVADAGADDVKLTLERPGSLRGTVRTSEGGPPPRCTVRAFGGTAADAECDAAGAFLIEDLPPGDYTVSAAAPGYARATKQATVAGGVETRVELELSAGGTVNGRIKGLSSDELARCSVSGGGASAEPNGDGTFTLRGVTPGRVVVVAGLFPENRQRSATTEITDVAVPVEVELDFTAGLTLSGSVTRGGRPAADLIVMAGTAGRSQRESAASDASGHWQLSGLDPGDIDVSVQDNAGRILVSRRISATTDTRVDLEVPSGAVSGRVVSAADRTPVLQAGVELSLAGGAPLVRRTVTDESGAFRIDELPDGTYTARASAPGYSVAETSVALSMGEAPEVQLELPEEQVLELIVHEPDGRAPDQVYLLPMRNGVVENSAWVPVGRDGRARVTSLPPGDTTLYVGGTGAAVVRVNVPSRGNAVQLAPTGTLVVITPLTESGVTRVRFATAGGLVVPVSLWSSPTRDGWVEAEGGRVTQRLPAGPTIVDVVGPDGTARRQTANVTPGGVTTVAFE